MWFTIYATAQKEITIENVRTIFFLFMLFIPATPMYNAEKPKIA